MDIGWKDVRTQLRRGPTQPAISIATVTDTGVYAWWDLGGALAGFYPEHFPPVDVSLPLYVGLAKDGSLASRCYDTHVAAKTRRSTVRRSLAALLGSELQLVEGGIPHPKMKFSLSVAGDAALTEWMLDNLRLTWVAHAAPGNVERDVIDSLLPPLNDKFAHRGEYWRYMARAREQFYQDLKASR